MTNGNDPIQPLSWKERPDGVPQLNTDNNGLSKREYFAAMRKPPEHESVITKMVAEAVMGTPAPSGVLENIKWWIEAEEKIAVMHADALINALNEKP